MEAWKQILLDHGIDTCACIPFSACHVTRAHLLPFEAKCAVMFVIPYLTGKPQKHKVSLYAASEDYHVFAKDLFERCEAALQTAYPGSCWRGFADHSPIAESDAVARAGLGIIGDNYMLITEKYGSYVFLGEFLTDADLPCDPVRRPEGCSHCGACRRVCPGTDPCLSALTQKKGELTEEEQARILQYGSAWGCDLCQLVCPLNRNAAPSPIPFFYENRMEDPTAAEIRALTDEQFARRAFAWRGRKTVLRNLDLLEAAQNGMKTKE